MIGPAQHDEPHHIRVATQAHRPQGRAGGQIGAAAAGVALTLGGLGGQTWLACNPFSF